MSPTSEIRIEFPWSDRAITPNGHCSWQKRARLTLNARNLASLLTQSALKGHRPEWKAVRLEWTLCPKTANYPDDNNAGGYVKAYCDGIADALRMNDATFRSTYAFGEPIKGGCVHVTISQIETEAAI